MTNNTRCTREHTLHVYQQTQKQRMSRTNEKMIDCITYHSAKAVKLPHEKQMFKNSWTKICSASTPHVALTIIAI